MCGILAIFCTYDDPSATPDALCQDGVERLSQLTHRGPDKMGYTFNSKYFLGHTRLCIQGTATSSQPIQYASPSSDPAYVSANAEIYNAAEILRTTEFETDCLAIPVVLDNAATDHELVEALNKLDGIFSFVHVQGTTVTVARSVCGVMNLFYGFDESEQVLVFTSERKAYPDAWLKPFPPSHVLRFELDALDTCKCKLSNLDPYMTRFERLTNPIAPPMGLLDPAHFRALLTQAVAKRLCTVRFPECGFLLSGGMDSSVIVAIARQLYPDATIRTFAIGLDVNEGDLPVAQKVADHLGTEHTSYTFTVQEGLDALPAAIEALETIDTTTVRAGTPMYLLIKKIKQDHPELKVLFSGEGADELLYGYLTWHESPNLEASRKFSIYLLEKLFQFDVLRAHQTGMAHSVEVRVPFLDKEFVRYVTQLHPAFLTPICGKEKYFLRKAFQHLLPACVVDRQKEQFSDGVGNAWIDTLRKADHRALIKSKESLGMVKKPTSEEQCHVFDLCVAALGVTQFMCMCEDYDTWAPEFSACKDPSGRSSHVHKGGRLGKM